MTQTFISPAAIIEDFEIDEKRDKNEVNIEYPNGNENGKIVLDGITKEFNIDDKTKLFYYIKKNSDGTNTGLVTTNYSDLNGINADRFRYHDGTIYIDDIPIDRYFTNNNEFDSFDDYRNKYLDKLLFNKDYVKIKKIFEENNVAKEKFIKYKLELNRFSKSEKEFFDEIISNITTSNTSNTSNTNSWTSRRSKRAQETDKRSLVKLIDMIGKEKDALNELVETISVAGTTKEIKEKVPHILWGRQTRVKSINKILERCKRKFRTEGDEE